MITALDTNILLDVLRPNPDFLDASLKRSWPAVAKVGWSFATSCMQSCAFTSPIVNRAMGSCETAGLACNR